jgi:guanine nucleotide-binding protein G(t) subunit alpha 3
MPTICLQKTSFLLFLNKFDIFEQKINKVPLNACEWFKDYKPLTSGQAEVENAYGYVKTKFEELYNESTPPDQRLDRVFKVYKTTALDENLIKRTFRLVDEVLVRQRLMDAKML